MHPTLLSLPMRLIQALLLLLLFALTSCHAHKKAARRREAARVAASHKSHDNGGHKITTQEYIATYKDIAVHNMRKFGVPASIILAQGILESANGNSELARYANNHFGIKCTNDWRGKKYYHDDDHPNECFRSYPNAEASFRDHVEFLKRPRYADLFSLRRKDYKGWAKGLKRDGYATNPKYPQLLINLIERYDLTQYE